MRNEGRTCPDSLNPPDAEIPTRSPAGPNRAALSARGETRMAETVSPNMLRRREQSAQPSFSKRDSHGPAWQLHGISKRDMV
jgi:hypothetical protein